MSYDVFMPILRLCADLSEVEFESKFSRSQARVDKLTGCPSQSDSDPLFSGDISCSFAPPSQLR